MMSTTEFVPSPNLLPNRSFSSSGKVQKTSNERSYLKSRRHAHRSEKRQTILNFLDKNLGSSSGTFENSNSSLQKKHNHHQTSVTGSPTQRRRNLSSSNASLSTAKTSVDSWSSLKTGSDHSTLDGSSLKGTSKQQQQQKERSRWKNPFTRKNSSTSSQTIPEDSSEQEQPSSSATATRDNSNNSSSNSGRSRSSRSSSRRSASRQKLADHLQQELKAQEQEQHDATAPAPQHQVDETYHTSHELVRHQQIVDRVLSSYPKQHCHSAEDHLMFAIAELTTLHNKLHFPSSTYQKLKTLLKDRLDAQEADEYMRKQHKVQQEQQPSQSSTSSSMSSPKPRKARTPKVRVVKNSISSTDKSDSKDHHQHLRSTRTSSSPSKSKSAPSIKSSYNASRAATKLKHKEAEDLNKEEDHYKHELNDGYYHGEQPLKDDTTAPSSTSKINKSSSSYSQPPRSPPKSPKSPNGGATADSSRSLALSSRSIVAPKCRPSSMHSLKPNNNLGKEEDHTSRTTLEDEEDNDDDLIELRSYVEEKFMKDAQGYRGTYTGPVDPKSGLPHGTEGKIEYRHSPSHKYDSYDGEWYQGHFSGAGTLLKTNGDVYHGQFFEGVFHGKGHYQYYHSSRHFHGRHVQGQRVEGTMTYKDGSIYKGQFYKGKRHGRGQYTFQDSSVYKGEFSEDRLHGIGQLTWPDGSKYIGEWSKGIRHGSGKEYKANGKLRFQGHWKDGNEVRD